MGGATALTNLRSALRRVRNAIDGDNPQISCLVTERDTAHFNPLLPLTLDVEQFELLVQGVLAHDHAVEYSCAACAERNRHLIALYRGPFLADIIIESDLFEQWRTALQDRYRRQVLRAMHSLAEYEFRSGSSSAAEELAHKQLEIEGWNEEAHRQLMRFLLASGWRSAALAQYELCRLALAAELDAVPSEETDALYMRILAGVAPPTSAPLANPYKGLEPFLVGDAAHFFGRESVIKRLTEAVQTQAFVALIGASGSGKSSVLHAGLEARLADGWCSAAMRPGATPLAALADALPAWGYQPPIHSSLAEMLQHGEITLADIAAALPSAQQGKRLLLIIDQFEEVFTLCRDIAARNLFFSFLLSATQPVDATGPPAVVLLAMRADFLGQALQQRDLADALQQHTLLLGPMVRREVQRAIEEPARLQGAVFEPGLVDRLLDDVGAEPGRLPLLQFALALLWLRQQDGWLTHAAYDEIGGLRGALTDYANDVYLHLSLAEQQTARHVFLTLVEPSLDAQDVRHLVRRSDMETTNWLVVQRLADARLVVTNTNAEGEETAELAHEALVREWGQLREWLTIDREFRSWQQQTRIAAEQWRHGGESEDALLVGGRLVEAEHWAAERQADIGPLIQRYTAAGAALREQRLQGEVVQRERELAQVQALAAAEHIRAQSEAAGRLRLLRLAIALTLVSGVAIGAALIAWQAQRQAEASARIALGRQVAAQAISVMQSKPDLALLLSLEALRLDTTAGSRTALLRELDIDPSLARILYGEPSALFSLGLQDRQQVLASNEQGAIVAWDRSLGKQSHYLEMTGEPVSAAAVSPLGSRFAIAQGMKVSLWDATTFTKIATLAGHSAPVRSIAFTRDGRRLLTSGEDEAVLLWDAQSGRQLQSLLAHNTRTVLGPVSLDGFILLLGDSVAGEDALDLWDATKNERLGQPLIGHSDTIHAYSVSPDGRLLATASFDGSVRLWDTATGAANGEPLLGQLGRVLFVEFSPDGKYLASGGTDSQVHLWDMALRKQVGAPLIGHSNWVRVAKFDVDGETLVTGDESGNLLVWNLWKQQRLTGHTDRVRSLAVSPDQKTLVTSGFDKQLIVWDAKALKQRRAIATPHQHAIITIAYSPAGSTLATVDAGGSILFWDTTSWQPRFPLRTAAPNVVLIGLSFSPDGRTLAAGAFDGVVRLWDVATGELLPHTIPAYTTGWALSVRFDPSGKLLATGGSDGVIKLWNPATQTPAGAPLEGHSNRVTALAFSPDGKTLASSSADGTVRLWNVASRTLQGEPLADGSKQIWDVFYEGAAGARWITLNGDGGIAWWDAASQSLVRPLFRTHMETEAMAAPAGGGRYYIASTGATALAITPDLGDWATSACAIANRSLTQEEWNHYLHILPYDPVCKG